MKITPKVGQALCLLAQPPHQLARCAGGYRRADGGAVITTRIARQLERDYLVDFIGPFRSGIELTAQGRAITQHMAEQEPAKAGVA